MTIPSLRVPSTSPLPYGVKTKMPVLVDMVASLFRSICGWGVWVG